MGTVPLPDLRKIFRPDVIIPVLLVAASLTGAGFVFFGDITLGPPLRQVTLEGESLDGNYFTTMNSVGDFLDEIGITISEFDEIQPESETPIRSGLHISYRKAVPVYITDAGDEPIELMTTAESICEIIDEYGFEVTAMDRIVPHPSTQVESGMEIEITRVEVMDVTSQREVEPGLVVEADPELPRGRMVEVSEGEPGVEEDITRYYLRNGEETARVELDSRIVVPPVDRVARVGVRSMPPLASRGGGNHRDILTMDATAYDPGPASCAPFADGRTATGHIAGFGVCAVDPDVIPLGTELWIEGYGYALACDTGGAIKGNRIDLCYDTRSEAMRWGRRDVLVYILD